MSRRVFFLRGDKPVFNNIFQKKTNIYSPVSGECIDITSVADPVFATKMMGDGIAIIPSKFIFSAPIEGKVVMIAETNHAFGIERKDGVSVLVHIGIDTVNLSGKGFSRLVSIDKNVKEGTPLIEVDKSSIPSNIDLTTMVIILDNKGHSLEKTNINKLVSTRDVVVSMK